MDIEELFRQYQTAPDVSSDARNQALIAAGFGLLGAPRGREWEAIGRAGLLGVNAYKGVKDDAREQHRQKIADTMRMEQLRQSQQGFQMQQQEQQQRQAEQQRLAAERAAMQRAAGGAFVGGQPGIPGGQAESAEGGMTPGIPARPGQFDPQAYMQGLQRENLPQQAIAFQQSQVKELPYDKPKPENYTPTSLAKYAVTRNVGDLVPVAKPDASPVGKINPSDFTPPSMAAFLAGGSTDYSKLVPIDKRSVSNVSVKNYAETEQQKAIGKARGERYSTINEGAGKAQSRLAALSSIETLMGDLETSALTPAGNKLAAYAKSVGVTIDPTLPRKEAAQAIMNQLALESRSTAEGGGMPGAMSEKDREFLIGMNPNMGQTPKGRKMLIEVQKRSANRTKQTAQWAREYMKMNNGVFDEGFNDYAAAKAEQNPLYADLVGVATPQPGSRRSVSGTIGVGAGMMRFDRYGNQLR